MAYVKPTVDVVLKQLEGTRQTVGALEGLVVKLSDSLADSEKVVESLQKQVKDLSAKVDALSTKGASEKKTSTKRASATTSDSTEK